MCSSADASLSPSQATAHGSWSMWIATPSYSFIVSDLHRLLIAGLPAHCERFWTLPRLAPRSCSRGRSSQELPGPSLRTVLDPRGVFGTFATFAVHPLIFLTNRQKVIRIHFAD